MYFYSSSSGGPIIQGQGYSSSGGSSMFGSRGGLSSMNGMIMSHGGRSFDSGGGGIRTSYHSGSGGAFGNGFERVISRGGDFGGDLIGYQYGQESFGAPEVKVRGFGFDENLLRYPSNKDHGREPIGQFSGTRAIYSNKYPPPENQTNDYKRNHYDNYYVQSDDDESEGEVNDNESSYTSPRKGDVYNDNGSNNNISPRKGDASNNNGSNNSSPKKGDVYKNNTMKSGGVDIGSIAGNHGNTGGQQISVVNNNNHVKNTYYNDNKHDHNNNNTSLRSPSMHSWNFAY